MQSRHLLPLVILLSACGLTRTTRTVVTDASNPSVSPALSIKITGVMIVAASNSECPSGGNLIQTFDDMNTNGVFDSGEIILSTTKICNGSNGSNGNDGIGAGIIVESASLASCSNGGSVFKTFTDFNNNTLLDSSENVTSVTTLCNGLNGNDGQNGDDGENGSDGQDGRSAHLTVTAANSSQCSSGGVVYTSSIDGQSSPDITVVCNGTNGSNGQNGNDANFAMGPVGEAIDGKSYSACHHDYLYIPNSTDPDRGWLTFRHQANGSLDQGIGSTGFQIWNVDIENFALISEAGGVTYCSLNWNASKRLLTYTVVNRTDGLEGQRGEISF